MLLFIYTFVHSNTPLFVISIHLMLLFIRVCTLYSQRIYNFNTSHVTVYLPLVILPTSVSSFQYISCYCLSKAFIDGYWYTLEFQYISCYCLSKELLDIFKFYNISIHLMLLFIVYGITDLNQIE